LFQKFFDSPYKRLGFVRFYEITIGPCIHRYVDILSLSDGGCKDDGRSRSATSYTLAKVNAVSVREPVIQDIEIKISACHFLLSGGNSIHRHEIEIRHNEFQNLACVAVILDTQNPLGVLIVSLVYH